MHEQIHPMAIHFMRGNFEGKILVKLGGGNIPQTVEFIHRTWDEFDTGYPFDYTWLDDEFGKLFETERRTAVILLVFSVVEF